MYLTKSQSRIVALGTLALFFIGGVTYVGLSRPSFVSMAKESPLTEVTPASDSSAAAPTPVTGSNFTLDNFHRSEMKDGKKVWEVSALKGTYFPETNTATLESPSLLFYRPNGEVVQLNAATATLALSGTSLTRAEISGNVRVVYSEKVTMETELAVYEKEANRVTAPGKVTISSAQLDIVGRELKAELGRNEFSLGKDVSSTVKKRALQRSGNA
ncbi:MAG: Lipopolysaccharide-assembly, LptC-related [Pseudomonadota bacterium]|jgi:LPS export ABC transporter protein LptC